MNQELTASDLYFDRVEALLNAMRTSQSEDLSTAAAAVAQVIMEDGLVYIFGTGHSHMIAEEGFYRAGGLLAVSPILDSTLMLHESAVKSSVVERLPGYAPILAKDYDLKSPGMLIAVSNSGRNSAPVEMAEEAKRRGLKVLAITSRAHSEGTRPRPPESKRLAEVADWVLDNGAPKGDACVDLQGIPHPVGPLSTIGGAVILNALFVQACAVMVRAGHSPDVIVSGNLDGADEWNKRLIDRWRPRIRHL